MFGKDRSGYVNTKDLHTIIQRLGKNPDEAKELLLNMQLENQDKLSFDEFLKIMKNLETKLKK
jgi:Ca2+-binding EF-hand superfamily protein